MNMETIVLLVDDDKYLLSALQRILGRHVPADWKILTAESAVEGLELLTSYPVAMVISDMHMPGMDGVRLLEKVRHMRPHAIRAMLTSDDSARTARDAVNRGEVFRYLLKPWDNEDVVRTVKDGVERYWYEVERKAMLRELVRENIELKNNHILMRQPGTQQWQG